MGQKVNPIAFRISGDHKGREKACWFANKKMFKKLVAEDVVIRKFIAKRASCKEVLEVCISRKGGGVFVLLYVHRSGVVIGKQGAEIELIKQNLNYVLNKPVELTVVEVKQAALSAIWVANSIARGISKRERPMQLMREFGKTIMKAGALGYRIRISGRHGGADIARDEESRGGSVPLHTLNCDIDFGCVQANTVYGVMGVTVWINNGEHSKVNYLADDFVESNFAHMLRGNNVKTK